MNDIELLKNIHKASKLDRKEDEVNLGEWYWYNFSGDLNSNRYIIDGAPEGFNTLVCIVYIGSNYVKPSLVKPGKYEGWNPLPRISFSEIPTLLKYEPNHKDYIQKTVNKYTKEANYLISEVKSLTARLGVSSNSLVSESKETSLALQDQDSYKSYQKDLIAAKNETLPELFNKVKAANSQIAMWLSAESIELSTQFENYEDAISKIEQRIDNVSLYAGLVEELECIKEGSTGEIKDKVHLMQRKLYMDEESLLAHGTEGIRFADLEEFETWLGKEPNFSRCLPFNKCIVAFQVRRKDYPTNRETSDMMDKIMEDKLRRMDHFTFIYIRNGEQLYRLSTEISLGDLIFPSKDVYDPQEQWMINPPFMTAQMSKNDYDVRKDADDKRDTLRQDWYTKNSYEEWHLKEKGVPPEGKMDYPGDPYYYDYEYKRLNPYYGGNKLDKEYELMTVDHVYYDDFMKEIGDSFSKYNRIALLIQGILDRSLALHPHPPVQSWEQDSFTSRVKLIYDGEGVLTYGEAPDIRDYIEKCNSLATINSAWYGQFKYFEKDLRKQCSEKASYYEDSWKTSERLSRHFDGNPGPKNGDKATKLKKDSVVFSWKRAKRGSKTSRDHYYSQESIEYNINDSIEIPMSKIFNMSGYTKGDFKRFFADPRTRQNYLQWAPMMLAAEAHLIK